MVEIDRKLKKRRKNFSSHVIRERGIDQEEGKQLLSFALWFSNFSEHENHVESISKHSLLDPSPRDVRILVLEFLNVPS